MQMLRLRTNSRWLVPGFAVVLGAVMLAAEWANDDPRGGLISLAIMLAFAAALIGLSGRSGVFEVMRNPHADERSAMLDLRATAFAGLVLIGVVIGAFIYDIARGHDPSPYGALGAIAGVAYLVALIVLQRRS
jgi:drug/metabolite transporter (DMT)-like permease